MTANLKRLRRSPRAPRTPTARDQKIFALYNYEGRRQTELAADFGLSQGRISEIIRRVAAWLASASAKRRDSPGQRLRLNRQLQQERLNLICREAVRQFFGAQAVVIKKSGRRGDEDFEETTERTSPASLQCLKLLLAATRELGKLAASDPLASDSPDAAERETIMEEELLRLYEEAIAEGKVEPVPDPAAVVDRWLDDFLGETGPYSPPVPRPRPPCQAQTGPSAAYAHALAAQSENPNIPTKPLPPHSPQPDATPPLPAAQASAQKNQKPPIRLAPHLIFAS